MIQNVELNEDGKWHFSTIKNQYAVGYYMVYYRGNGSSKAKYVHDFYWDENATYYEENKSWRLSNADYTVLTWGVDQDGYLSNIVDMYKFHATTSSSAPEWQQALQLEHVGTIDAKTAQGIVRTPLNLRTRK